MKNRFYAVLMGGGLWLLASLSLAQYVVIGGGTADLKAGDVLAPDQSISLQAGEAVILLAANGQTVRLTGPFSGAAGGDQAAGEGKADQGVVSALSELFKQRDASDSSLGVIRAVQARGGQAGAVESLPVPELFNVQGEGGRDYCIYGDQAGFWRTDASANAVLALSSGDLPEQRHAWRAGEDRIAVAADAFSDGGEYQLAVGDVSQWVKVHRTDGHDLNPAALAAWMVGQGCAEQALALLETIK